MFDLDTMQEAIYRENAGGWLFSSLQHRDFLSESILELNTSIKNTRPWFYVVYPVGSPTKILHGIEPEALSELPGETLYYQSRETLANIFRSKILHRAPVLACQFSPSLPVISTLDHGTCLFLEECGFRLISAASLIQRFRGLLTPPMIESHERAAVHLREIVDGAWAFISRHFTSRKSLREGTVQHFILEEFRKRGLITSSPPLVAVGTNTANPHYTLRGKGKTIDPGEVVQLDLWAKEEGSNAVYADISWIGFTGDSPPVELQKTFSFLCQTRNRTAEFIAHSISSGTPIRGRDVDAFCRDILIQNGYEQALRHRTGHGIDREVHGSGVNLDSVEFPDDRFLLEGSCFSIEPGLYFPSFGLRTEINGYIQNSRFHISGPSRQERLLT